MNRYYSVVCSLLRAGLFFYCICTSVLYSWTHTYQETFCPVQRMQNQQKQYILFSKSNITHFTQLLVSWNANKPKHGHFSFYAQVRDAETRKWGKWHRMYEWGTHKQHSYYSKSDGTSTHHHVRLEADKNKKLDGFRVKVVAHKADLSLVHGLFANTSDLQKFSSELQTFSGVKHESVYVENVGKIPQLGVAHKDAPKICSPTSCAMVHQFLSGHGYNIDMFTSAVFDKGLNIYGSWPFNVSYLFEVSNGSAYAWVQRFNSFAQLHAQLQKNTPVIVSVRGDLPGALKKFPHGHLLVVVGFDGATNEVICHDPACHTVHQVEKRYKVKHFINAWENSRRLGYCISKII